MRISSRAPEAPPILTDTGLPAFTRHWQLEPPQDALVVIVKGTFDLVPGGEAVMAAEPALPTGEEPFDDGEAVRYPGDVAIFKPACDVLVSGHVYPGDWPGVSRFGLRFGSGIQLRFAAFGPRTWTANGSTPPEPFDYVPLRPELAFGGPGHPLNPLGRGVGARTGDPMPQLERLDAPLTHRQDRPDPVLLTPLAEAHPMRQALAGTYDAAWAKTRFPWFPKGFDWSHFQAAPPELRVPYPAPRTPFTLEGLHPRHPAIEGTLPGFAPRAFVIREARSDALEEVRLRLDTVFFEPDLMRVVLVWRGFVHVSDLYARDVGAVFVTGDPAGAELSIDEVVRRYEAEYERRYAFSPPELDAPDPLDEGEDQVPEGRRRPKGLTPSAARALGLPAWTASEPESAPRPEPPLPPPPPGTLARRDREAPRQRRVARRPRARPLRSLRAELRRARPHRGHAGRRDPRRRELSRGVSARRSARGGERAGRLFRRRRPRRSHARVRLLARCRVRARAPRGREPRRSRGAGRGLRGRGGVADAGDRREARRCPLRRRGFHGSGLLGRLDARGGLLGREARRDAALRD